MITARTGHLAAALAVMAVIMAPPGAAAQSLDALDALVQASAKPADGVALARTQVAASAWLDALATLERVLMADPKNKPARLLHASVLCRIDDPAGAAAEFTALKAKDYKKAEWAEARAACPAAGGTR